MTAKETIDIIRESPLWDTLLLGEKVEAIAHALEAAGCGPKETDDISVVVGETYAGN